MASRVLVTEPLAQVGLETLTAAGFDVDVAVGLSPEELLGAVRGVSALVIRSATQVNADVLDAGTDLVVVGRAGIGLDNVDVATATRKGVMVVNAPQSNILSAAEHAVALLIAQARNVPQADADLKAGNWRRSKWEGVELHGKTLGIVGLGRVGGLVAQRALAFGMHLIAYDPYVSAERARQMGVDLQPTVAEVAAQADFLTIHLPRTPETIGLIGRELLAQAKPGIRIINTARGGIIDEEALYDAIVAGRVAGAGLDVFAEEPTTKSPLFELESVVVTPHLGASTVEAQDKAGQTIAEQVVLALRGDFVPYAVNVAAGEASETVRRFLPLAERLGRLFSGLAGAGVETLELSFEGQVADYDCRILGLSILKGLFTPVSAEPVSFVNAPQLAAERGLNVRETKTSSSRDYVNLISLRGRIGDRVVAVAGTLAGRSEQPRIVGIDDHIVDLPPSRHMLVVRNDDRPGMIGAVGTTLGRAGINIADMALGRGPTGEHALMVLATDSPVTAEVVEDLRAQPGILDAKSIDLD
ncbi:MAG TPA: phosphoglycerate dehydrogenase [Acidimicrobiia bacterium]|nr:phosphoglycerate dehydrogenase [Acidimicrobiia bacterium]